MSANPPSFHFPFSACKATGDSKLQTWRFEARTTKRMRPKKPNVCWLKAFINPHLKKKNSDINIVLFHRPYFTSSPTYKSTVVETRSRFGKEREDQDASLVEKSAESSMLRLYGHQNSKKYVSHCKSTHENFSNKQHSL